MLQPQNGDGWPHVDILNPYLSISPQQDLNFGRRLLEPANLAS